MKNPKNKKAASHLVYEIMMFHGTAYKLLYEVTDPFLKNVFIESFAIHCRNLYDFFYTKPNNSDDVNVYNFSISKRNFNIEKANKKTLQVIKRKANKQVSHLTYSRINYNSIHKKAWNVLKIYENMSITILSFLKNLSAEEKEWFKECYQTYGVQ